MTKSEFLQPKEAPVFIQTYIVTLKKKMFADLNTSLFLQIKFCKKMFLDKVQI